MRRAIWIGVAILSLILIVVAARRILHLSGSGAGFDMGFAHHARLALMHIFPGVLFVLLGPLHRRPTLHRWLGRILLADALLVGVTQTDGNTGKDYQRD